MTDMAGFRTALWDESLGIILEKLGRVIHK